MVVEIEVDIQLCSWHEATTGSLEGFQLLADDCGLGAAGVFREGAAVIHDCKRCC